MIKGTDRPTREASASGPSAGGPEDRLSDGWSSEPAVDPQLDSVADHPVYERVLAALHAIPERWQQALWYADVLQEPLPNIATLMGSPPDATPDLVHRARQGLRTAYADNLNANPDSATGSSETEPRIGHRSLDIQENYSDATES